MVYVLYTLHFCKKVIKKLNKINTNSLPDVQRMITKRLQLMAVM